MDIPLDEVIHFDAVTSAATGAATDADSTPTFGVFEEATDTPILSAQNFTKRTSLTGNYRGAATLSAANGFEVGKWYNVVASATVGGVAGKAVVKTFRVAAAESVAGAPVVDVGYVAGTAASLGTDTTVRTGTAQAGGSTSITLDSGASATTDFYKYDLIYLSAGAGAGQYRFCTAYNGTTKVATVTPAWAVNPDGTTSFAVLAAGIVKVADGTIDTATFAAGTTIPRCTLADTLTTYAGNTPQTGDSFARIGATGSGLTSLAPSSTALSAAQWTNSLATNLGTLAGHDPGATLASQTNITAGTVTTVSGNVNGSVGGSVGSVAGDIGGDLNGDVIGSVNGNVDGSVGSVGQVDALGSGSITSGSFAADAITGDVFSVETGLKPVRTGACQSGSTSATIKLDASASSVNNFYDNDWAVITFFTGAGQIRQLSAYNGTTKVATVTPAWTTTPDGTSLFSILPRAAAVQTGDSFARIGATGSGLTSLASQASVDAVDDYIDTEVAAIKAKTDNLPASPASTTNITAASGVALTSAYDFAKGTVAVTESYNSDGSAPTPVQALLVIMQMLTEMNISGTTMTVKKLDGSATAFTLTLNNGTTPTAVTRAT